MREPNNDWLAIALGILVGIAINLVIIISQIDAGLAVLVGMLLAGKAWGAWKELKQKI